MIARSRRRYRLMLPLIRALILASILGLLQGCSTLSYYSHSIGGHLQLMGQRQPIPELLRDPQTPEPLQRKLRQVGEIRHFASAALALPDNGSYLSYAALDREAVVWSVVAAGRFSLQPKQWCYPFVGCASYRGYFSQERARAYAGELQAQGMDVAVLPVPAYSSLGWFDDPLPSTVIDWPAAEIAGLIFHELAHQQLYVKHDSAFNEAFASLVAEVGIERWLGSRNGLTFAQWQVTQQREQQFVDLLLALRGELETLYRQPLDELRMGQRKAALFRQLREHYAQLKRQWGGYAGFDGWFDRDLNNAHLVSIATYEAWVPAFRRLLVQSGGDLPTFYAASRELGQLPASEREQRMRQLLQPAAE
jgi:predicted aminopeptidase